MYSTVGGWWGVAVRSCCACAVHVPSRFGLGLRSGPTDCLKDEILSELGLGNVRAACMGISAGLEGLSPYTCRAHVDMLGALAYYISWVQ